MLLGSIVRCWRAFPTPAHPPIREGGSLTGTKNVENEGRYNGKRIKSNNRSRVRLPTVRDAHIHRGYDVVSFTVLAHNIRTSNELSTSDIPLGDYSSLGRRNCGLSQQLFPLNLPRQSNSARIRHSDLSHTNRWGLWRSMNGFDKEHLLDVQTR